MLKTDSSNIELKKEAPLKEDIDTELIKKENPNLKKEDPL